jgi:hypothetical protein
MNDGITSRMWRRVSSWFDAEATHATVQFLPDPGAAPLLPYEGYLRLWLAEGFLGKSVTWTDQHFPVLHGGLALSFLGHEGTAFTTFTQQADMATAHGAFLNFPVTPLLPFNGGVVEAQAALYRATVAGPLGPAVALAGSLASLVGPPLTLAANIADKVSAGLDKVLAASKDQPVLGVHYAMQSLGGGGDVLRPGRLVVADAPPEQLGGVLVIGDDGRVALDTPTGRRPFTGVNHLVLRIECRTERDDWRFPELEALIQAARTAALEGSTETFQRRRTEALVRTWNSPDLADADRKRVANLVGTMIDEVNRAGAVPGPALSMEAAASRWLLARDAPQLATLRFQDLVGVGPVAGDAVA